MSLEFEAKVGKVVNRASFVDTGKVSKRRSSRFNFQRATTGRSIRCQKAMIE